MFVFFSCFYVRSYSFFPGSCFYLIFLWYLPSSHFVLNVIMFFHFPSLSLLLFHNFFFILDPFRWNRALSAVFEGALWRRNYIFRCFVMSGWVTCESCGYDLFIIFGTWTCGYHNSRSQYYIWFLLVGPPFCWNWNLEACSQRYRSFNTTVIIVGYFELVYCQCVRYV